MALQHAIHWNHLSQLQIYHLQGSRIILYLCSRKYGHEGNQDSPFQLADISNAQSICYGLLLINPSIPVDLKSGGDFKPAVTPMAKGLKA